MRVIAGEHKGRQIKSVPGRNTRPTADKVKEAVFHKMGPYFTGGRGLDLFAGSGSLGIEALSRGMDEMVFIDQSPQAIRTIHHNIAHLHVKDRSTVYRNDAFRALHLLQKQKVQFDLILLDPPYEKVNYERLLQAILEKQFVHKRGFLYVEHPPFQEVRLDHAFDMIFQKKYNETTSVSIFQQRDL